MFKEALAALAIAGLGTAGALVTMPSAAAMGAPSAVEATFGPTTHGQFNKTLHGSLVVFQTASGKTHIRGALSGLAPYSLFVAVPYKDSKCTPLPGVTAFPSGAFFTDVTGHAHVDVDLNPKSINPAGKFTALQTRSVSVRRVVLQSATTPSVPVPGIPTLSDDVSVVVGTPTVPNVVLVEGCDRHPQKVNY